MEQNNLSRQHKGKKSKAMFALLIALIIAVSFVGGYFSNYLFNKKSVRVTSDIVRIMENVGYVIDPETGEEREITEEERNNLACNLPYGKQRKLEIARALATNPKLLLLDSYLRLVHPKAKV